MDGWWCAVRMLVVDDEPQIAEVLDEFFSEAGFSVTCVQDGFEALRAASRGFDIILLDVNMPGMDGFEVCRRLREHMSCPIIFLTARIEDVDQIDGFSAGADDYVLKPFSLEVLGRRVAAHMAREGRAQREGATARFFRDITIDYARRTVEVRSGISSTSVAFTKLEFDIVALLSKRPGQIYDRDAIFERVWGWDSDGDATLVREHIRRIRRKFLDAGLADDPIHTVWGVGYAWAAQ